MTNEAFYYIDGEPLNGNWIDLDAIDSIDDVLEELTKQGHIPRNAAGIPEYDGDLLVADYEGDLAGVFYQGGGNFNLDEFIEVRDSGVDENIAVAFISLFNEWNTNLCEENYIGHFDSPEDFAKFYLDGTGVLSQIPDNLHYYIDFETFAKNELLICSYTEADGHYFYNW